MNKAFVWKDEGDYTKELMKVFSGSSAMWREWRMIAKGVYVGELAGSHSVGRPRKRCTDNVKNCLRKRGLDVRQARRMVQGRSEWRGFVRGNAWGRTPDLEEMSQLWTATTT